MKRAVCGVGVLSLLCCALLGAGETRIAVVNVSLIVEKYRKQLDAQNRLNAMFDPEKESLNKRNRDLDARAQALQVIPDQTSLAALEAVQSLRRAQFIYEHDLNGLNNRIQEALLKEMKDVLTDIRAAVKKVAQAHGYTLVFRSPDTDNPVVAADPETAALSGEKTHLELTPPQNMFEVLERFNRNPVFLGSPDITLEVLTLLNNDYAKRSAPGK